MVQVGKRRLKLDNFNDNRESRNDSGYPPSYGGNWYSKNPVNHAHSSGYAYGGSYEFSPYRSAELPEKKRSRGGPVAILIVACMIISLFGGYLGALMAKDSPADISEPPRQSDVLFHPQEYTAPLPASGESSNLPAVVGMIKDSVVEVIIEEQAGSNFFSQYVETGAGSGVIVSENGYVVTCAHVVAEPQNIKVILSDGSSYDAKVVGIPDDVNDIALLKIDAEGLNPAVMGDSDKLVVGEESIVIGNPLGSFGGTVTNGIISALEREVVVEGKSMVLLQTNAAVNPGNSGGGMFNAKGELIGIINAKSIGQNIEGLGFAIPINIVKNAVEQLLDVGYVSAPAIGIKAMQISSQSAAEGYGVERFGVYIDELTAGKGAEAAGLLAGDFILSIEGTVIDTIQDISALLRNYSVGDTVEMVVLRQAETLTFQVVLSERNS